MNWAMMIDCLSACLPVCLSWDIMTLFKRSWISLVVFGFTACTVKRGDILLFV